VWFVRWRLATPKVKRPRDSGSSRWSAGGRHVDSLKMRTLKRRSGCYTAEKGEELRFYSGTKKERTRSALADASKKEESGLNPALALFELILDFVN
jgi:hypothetical protein